MNYLVLLLRILHIGAGVFWVGGVLIMTFFVSPTVGATAESGQKFVVHLMNNVKFSARMSAAAGLTILAGFLLYWIDSDGFSSAWMRSGPGIGFGIGAVFALVGFIYGILLGRTMKAMAQAGARLSQGGPPSSEQMAQMQSLRNQQVSYSKISAITLILSVVLMAIARYLVF
jgi:uncharacterized membrane protein